jgi:endonuclease/exonuclease/phosphatase (EEP) superfamily protein YafD
MMPPVRRRLVLVALPWAWFLVRDVSVVMELVAVALPLLVAAAFAVAVALRWKVVALSLALFGLVSVGGPWVPQDTGHPARGVTIAVANMLKRNEHAEAVADDIVAQHADIVVVPEATKAVHDRLAAVYPYSIRADRLDDALGVYSTVPISEPRVVPGLLPRTRQLRIEVDGPGDDDFVLWAVHLPKPWLVATGGYEMKPGGHARKLDDFLDAFAAETEPLVVAGDTNLTDRGRGYRKLTDRFGDALRTTWGGPTARKSYLRPLLLRVDHVFIPPAWCSDRGHRFDLTGSDHRGVRVRVGPCRR